MAEPRQWVCPAGRCREGGKESSSLCLFTWLICTDREWVPLSVEPSLSLCGVLGSIPSTEKREENGKGRRKRKEKTKWKRAQPTDHVFIDLTVSQIPMEF